MGIATTLLQTLTFFCSILLQSTTASTTVNVAFFNTSHCATASDITPNAALPLNVCVDTPGLISFNSADASCENGGLTVWVFLDPTCGEAYRYLSPNECWSPNAPDAIAALVMGCGDYQPTVTATTTYVVGDVITQAPAIGATSTAASSQTGSTSSTSTTVVSSNSGSGWSSLSYGEKVGVIVAIAMGLPAIIIAFLTLKLMMRGR